MTEGYALIDLAVFEDELRRMLLYVNLLNVKNRSGLRVSKG
jgi:hypothetical protein